MMKILLISGDTLIASRINRYFTPAGYGLIHYNNPLKAMDNYREIRPDVVLFHEREFPRHWKLAVKFLRELYSRDSSLFILLADEEFRDEDAHKAHFLGVNGIMPYDGSMESLESMILRYKVAPDVRKSQQLVPVRDNSLNFMFMNPVNLQLITAHVLEISVIGAVLKVDEAYKVSGMEKGTVLKHCSLNTAGGIVDLDVRVEHSGSIMEIRFLDGMPQWQDNVQNYIKALI